jgi:DNA-binding MarR family transcriptional regulator
MNSSDLCDEVLISLRRIVRAVELQSRQLVRSHGLTGPQAVILKALMRLGSSTVGQLADQVSLSKPTVTDILNRLEKHKLVKRIRSDTDKRCVQVAITGLARRKLISSPPLLQDEFARQFSSLKKWEQFQLLSSLDKIAEMMNAKKLDASPILTSGPISTPEEISEINLLTRCTDHGDDKINSSVKKSG